MINKSIFSINFSSEKIIKDWTLSDKDLIEILKYRKKYRAFLSIQICSIRLYGSFIKNLNNLAPDIISYINNQLKVPPSIIIDMPIRNATYVNQRKKIRYKYKKNII